MSEHSRWRFRHLSNTMADLLATAAAEDRHRWGGNEGLRQMMLVGRKCAVTIWSFDQEVPVPAPEREPTVPELRGAWQAADDMAATAFGEMKEAERRWQAATRARDDAGKLLDTAEWEMRVESARWVAQPATDRYGGEHWWHIWLGVMALRWRLNERRGATEGYLPSRELAVREPGQVARP